MRAIATMNAQHPSITLIGPGGAGKSTIGALVAEQVAIRFVDLDSRFGEHVGDISQYINRVGYDVYARKNVEIYCSLIQEATGPCVVALSSGFMTYPQDVHLDYAVLRRNLAQNPATFVLIPSLDREACVAETVRRQLTRPFARSRAREEAVIRERFSSYMDLPARKIRTMRPLAEIVEELHALIRCLWSEAEVAGTHDADRRSAADL